MNKNWLVSIVAGLVLGAGPLGAQITSVPLPDPKIPGFQYPESEATIVGWVRQMTSGHDPQDAAFNKVHLHGWGLWTALTQETDQVLDGQKLRVFETWATPGDLAPLPTGLKSAHTLLLASRPARTPLRKLRQFDHARALRALRAGGDKAKAELEAKAATTPEDTAVGFVKYDPSAAAHIVTQGLLSKSALDTLLKAGANQVPAFPATAFALKPVFQPTGGSLVGGRYYQLPVWSGPPAAPAAFPETDWPGSVWVDMQGGGQGNGEIDKVGKKDGSSRTEATTYPLSSFIYFTLSAADAQLANAARKSGDKTRAVAAGDVNILTAMHVAGREITRWTWQTFWWSPNADSPPPPSSAQIAALRPAQLKGVARHYAMALAYSNLAPADPYVGDSNTGNSVYAYNPYLEARFGPGDLPDSKDGMSNGQKVANNVGTQTNCMSCHGSANYNPANLSAAPNYTGDRHVNLNDPRFQGTLQVDFLWSLPDNAQ